MSAPKLTKWIPAALKKIRITKSQTQGVQSVFGIKELLQQEKPCNIIIEPVSSEHHEQAVQMLKDHFLAEHVLLRAHAVDLTHDNALDEYLHGLLKQGNTILAKTEDGTPVGICVNTASSPTDPEILRKYAFYRQNPITKDFLNFTAKLQETPNLWEVFKVPEIFEIKMLAVVPEYRRRGLGTMLAESSNEMAETQGFDVVRMDCINPHDFKVAERILFQCLVKYPLRRLGARTPGAARVYVRARSRDPPDADARVYVRARSRDPPDADARVYVRARSRDPPDADARVYVRARSRDPPDADARPRRPERDSLLD